MVTSKTKKTTGNAAYLIFGEHLRSNIVRRQVIDVVVALRQKVLVRKFFLIVFLPWHMYFRSRRSIAEEILYLRQHDIICHVIPTPISFPFYNFKEKRWKIVSNYHTFLYVPLLLLYTLPVVLFYHLFLNVQLFHCRSYPVSLSVLLIKRLLPKIAFIFDPRSDYPEECALQNNWSADNLNFRIWKYLEKKICTTADTIIVIGPPFDKHFKSIYHDMQTVNIFNNVNTKEFVIDVTHRKQLRATLHADNKVIFCYAGSMYNNYWNDPELYARFISQFTSSIDVQPLFMFLVPSYCRKTLVEALHKYKIDLSLCLIESPDYSDVPRYLSACDIALYFLPYSSPRVGIKFVEYCSMGIPTVVNMNVAGASELVAINALGVSLNNTLFDGQVKANEDNIYQLKKLVNEKESYGRRCRDFAIHECDTNVVADSYASVYSEFMP